jgi:hypothetical protein
MKKESDQNKFGGWKRLVDSVPMLLFEVTFCFICITPGIKIIEIYGLNWITPIPLFVGGQIFQTFLTRNR